MNNSSSLLPLDRRRWAWRIGVGLVLALTLLALLLYNIDGRATVQALAQAKPLWVAAALFSVLLNGLAKTFRWRLLFPTSQPIPSRRQTLGILMAGQLVNSVLPFRGGDVFRAYFMGRDRGASTAATVGTIGAEKLIDLILLGLMVSILLPLIALPPSIHTNQAQMLALALAVGLVWLALIMALPRLESLLMALSRHFPFFGRWAELLRRLLSGLTALREWQRLPPLITWSLAVWATAILTNLLLFQALALPPSFLHAALVLVFIYGGITIPVAPGQLGVFEALTVVALSLVGIEGPMALAYALLLHAAVLFVPLLIGGMWLWRRARR